jgi:hypothetical protein
VTGWWFSLSTPISFTDKTDRHDIAEILLKVALNTINQTSQTTNKEFIIKSTGIDNDLGRHPIPFSSVMARLGFQFVVFPAFPSPTCLVIMI